MALIQCPECGKQISDKAQSCPNCAYPISIHAVSESTPDLDMENNTRPEQIFPIKSQTKRFSKKSVSLISAIALVIVAGIVIFALLPRPQKVYNQALDLLNLGEYQDAMELLNTIPDYEDTADLIEQARQESIVLECVGLVRQTLLNPDSMQIYDIKLGINEGRDDGIIDEEHPSVYVHLGAQNRMGGNTELYAYCSYEDDGYKCMGTCDTLDMGEFVEETKDFNQDELIDSLGEALALVEITRMQNNIKFRSVEGFDLNRIQTLVKNNAYQSVKLIN